MPLWTVLYVGAFWVALVIIVAMSWRFGDAPVRYSTSALAVTMIASALSHHLMGWNDLDLLAMVIDATFLFFLVALAMRWPRWWLLVLAATQLIEALGHLAKAWYSSMTRLTYAILVGGGAYVQLLLLGFGLYVARCQRLSDESRSNPCSPQRDCGP